ncbi:hypothetical protein N7481_009551 [Penicillium waksmanii]|uniref:uncharacterized protein n=1 Tax=Penicillium waksmanii TaxID=69791 RepID=UPI00254719CF|nr:uncharacterized protein N7481_009551 [Penicillium waksmanii]KAJ5975844.1 hypothetical protein N7481_009551 [Penicillium waksmanii]
MAKRKAATSQRNRAKAQPKTAHAPVANCVVTAPDKQKKERFGRFKNGTDDHITIGKSKEANQISIKQRAVAEDAFKDDQLTLTLSKWFTPASLVCHGTGVSSRSSLADASGGRA